MIFESVTFKPGKRRAVLSADAPMGRRFQVVIDPPYAIDLWGLRRPVQPSEFAAAIQEHMDEITKAAVAACAGGELVLQLD